MKLLHLMIKNILVNKWRSLSLGSLIFFAGLLMVLSNSSFMTMKDNMENALINTVLGEVQIRPNVPDNNSITMAGKAEPAYLDSQKVGIIETTVQSQIKPREYTKRVTHNILLVSDTEKSGSRIIGLGPNSTAYQKTFKLIRGRYLDPNKVFELLLTEEQAKKLKVDVGDVIGVMSQTRDGYIMDSALTLVGIGNFDLLSTVSVAYTDLKSAQELIGFSDGEVSDLILYTSDKSQIQRTADELKQKLQKSGINPADVKVTTYRNSNSFELSGISIYIAMFYSFVAILLFIIGILIINLVYMIGIERRQEIGTLRAIGFSKINIIGIFVGEIVLVTTFFSIIGVLCGSILVFFFSKVGITANPPLDLLIGKHFFMQFKIGLILAVLTLLPCFSMAASIYPAYVAASLKPVDTLKEI